jgi:DNA repair exonuclease SbcCD ATPase subunit
VQGGKTIAVDLAIESSAFEALEKDVMEVLQEVMGDKNLDGFKVEYEKLHQALKNSHEAEKRLVKKCRELNNDITTNASKVQAALKVAQDEQQLIMQMKKDIERAWKTVEASHEKESNMKQQIQTLRAGIAELNESIEQGSGMTSTQDSTIVELGRQRDELQTQREELVARIMQAHPRPHPPPTLANRHQCGVPVAQLRQENAEREGHYRTLDNERERIERDIEEYAETIKQKQKVSIYLMRCCRAHLHPVPSGPTRRLRSPVHCRLNGLP